MPTYDYACEHCGYAFERFQSMTAKPVRVCPECGRRTVKRLIGAGAGMIFKGSGFYITDYRSDGYRKAAKRDKEGGGDQKASPSGSPKDASFKSAS